MSLAHAEGHNLHVANYSVTQAFFPSIFDEYILEAESWSRSADLGTVSIYVIGRIKILV